VVRECDDVLCSFAYNSAISVFLEADVH